MLIEHRYQLAGPRPPPFALYGALSRVLPIAHGSDWAIAPCHQRSGFVIRGPDSAPDVREVVLQGRRVVVRLLESVSLIPTCEMWSAIVVIKLTAMPASPAEFRSAIERHVRVRCAALAVRQVELGCEREIRVHGRGVRGFEVSAHSGDPLASLRLLESGLGGKRSIGCGVFHDVRSPWR